MKKSLIVLPLLAFYSLLSGQEIVFLETCGKTDVISAKKVDLFTGWDNSSPVIFSRTTTLDGTADVRITSTTTNHVWFPADKNSDLIIKDIPSAGFKHLKLSFDIAAYKLADANANKLILYCNDIILTIPSLTFPTTKFSTLPDIELSNTDYITLKFEYTAENNTSGYRMDNFKITGEKITSNSNDPKMNHIKLFISGNKLVAPDFTDGTRVEILNPVGMIIQSSEVKNGLAELSSNLKKGLYIVRIGNLTSKIMI